MRDVVGDLGGLAGRGDALDGGFEENGGGGAVDVVVAVDEDGLGVGDGTLDAGDGSGHAEEQVGVVEVVEGWGLRKRRAAASSRMPRATRRAAAGNGQPKAASAVARPRRGL